MEKRKKDSKGDATLESLRIAYTELSQEQFIAQIGLNGTTYRRWLTKKSPPRLTPEQISNICHLCQISFDTFFECMSGRTNKKVALNNQPILDDIEIEIPTANKLAEMAKKLKVSLKALYEAFGIDITGIPDDRLYSEQSAPPEEKEEGLGTGTGTNMQD